MLRRGRLLLLLETRLDRLGLVHRLAHVTLAHVDALGRLEVVKAVLELLLHDKVLFVADGGRRRRRGHARLAGVHVDGGRRDHVDPLLKVGLAAQSEGFAGARAVVVEVLLHEEYGVVTKRQGFCQLVLKIKALSGILYKRW